MNAIETLRTFIMNDLHYEGSAETLTPDYPLVENHVVDSLGLFRLVSFIEEHFGVEVGDAELLPENFGTIGQMVRLIERKRVG